MASQISRGALPLNVRLALARRRLALAGGADVDKEWNSFRASSAGSELVLCLRDMSTLDRCMYCRDSRSSDVEHVMPKSLGMDWVFDWQNLLWICTDCNRRKGNRVPKPSLTGSARVYDPCRDRFWGLFFLDVESGFVAPRWESVAAENVIARATLDAVSSLNHESVAERRRRACVRVLNCVDSVLLHGPSQPLMRGLVREAREDELGVCEWFFAREGRLETRVSKFASLYPGLAKELVRASLRT